MLIPNKLMMNDVMFLKKVRTALEHLKAVMYHRSPLEDCGTGRIVKYMQSKDNVWFGAHQEAAEYVKAQAGMK